MDRTVDLTLFRDFRIYPPPRELVPLEMFVEFAKQEGQRIMGEAEGKASRSTDPRISVMREH
ncbi:hypothetical protein KA005_52530, partial [bacterium]|nr:hypothetical protein [bacterium]